MDPIARDSEVPIVNIVGEKVALGPLRRDLLPIYTRWVNDFEVTRTLMIGPHPWTDEAEAEWYGRASKNDSEVHFTIYERSTWRPIGNTGLSHINHANRTAEFGIVIGEKGCWGKGNGTETASLMLEYAFRTLGLHNVVLRAFSFNERALRAYTRAGFRMMGRRREAIRLGTQVYDEIYMDCLASEFQSLVPKRSAAT